MPAFLSHSVLKQHGFSALKTWLIFIWVHSDSWCNNSRKECGCEPESLPAPIHILRLLCNDALSLKMQFCMNASYNWITLLQTAYFLQVNSPKKWHEKWHIRSPWLPWLHFWPCYSLHIITDGRKLKCSAFNFYFWQLSFYLYRKGHTKKPALIPLHCHKDKSRAWKLIFNAGKIWAAELVYNIYWLVFLQHLSLQLWMSQDEKYGVTCQPVLY